MIQYETQPCVIFLKAVTMSLSEQLSKVKLKKSDQPMRDYSDPKLAGFMKDEDISDYQKNVLEVNTERWLSSLSHLTFPSTFCPIYIEEALLFIKYYEQCYKDKTPGSVSSEAWNESIKNNTQDNTTIQKMTARLEVAMETYLKENSHVFVKTSSRSAKDAPVYQDKFKALYDAELDKIDSDKREEENEQICCLLKAAFQALKMKSASEVIDTFMSSERIYQDFLLATQHKDLFEENFIVRKFVEIDIDMEFRGFVFNGHFSALSQYNYLVHSKRLCNDKDKIRDMIQKFYQQEVKPCLADKRFPDSFIIDFAICNYGSETPRLWVIELNPFMSTTDGALFSWQHEKHILESQSGFEFRITEKPKPGAKTMLPYSIRKLVK